METRKCLECGYEISGRTDKKFCSDQCRNTYNNRSKKEANQYVRNISYLLRKNRRILESLAPEGKKTVHRNKLTEKGYNFEFFTDIYKTKSGKKYYFCFEYGFLPLENDFFAIVRKDIGDS